MEPNQQLARPAVLQQIEQAKVQFEGRLPEGMTVERFTYGLATAIQKTPALLECDPKSVILAAYEAAECGCDLSPSKAQGWIIPYGKTATFTPSYRHFIQLAYRSGVVKAFNSEVVYEKDKFGIVFAPIRTLVHEPNLAERGKPVGAYALIQFVDDHLDFEYLSFDEIERHRKHSKQPDSLMWRSFWTEGARKTAVRLLSKRLPQTNPAMDRMFEAIEHDSETDIDMEPPVTPPPEIRRLKPADPPAATGTAQAESKQPAEAPAQEQAPGATSANGKGKGKGAKKQDPPLKTDVNAKDAPSEPAAPVLADKDDVERFWKRAYSAGWSAYEVKKWLQEKKGIASGKVADVAKADLEGILREIESGGAPA